MKKLLTFIFAAVLVNVLCAGCGGKNDELGDTRNTETEPNRKTTEYVIVNKLDTEVVVEMKFGDKQKTIIKPGVRETFHTEVIEWYGDSKYPPKEKEIQDTVLEKQHTTFWSYDILDAEMRINGTVIPKALRHKYWSVDQIDYSDANTYKYLVATSLTLTNEVLKKIKSDIYEDDI